MPKSFLFACAAPLLVLTNVGCTSLVPSTPLPTRSAESTTPFSQPIPTAPVSPTPFQSSGAITLTVWTTDEFAPNETASGQIWRDQFGRFQAANPNIATHTVLKKAEGKGGILDSLMTTHAAAPTLLPDVAILNASDLTLLADAKIPQPLDGFVDDEFQNDLFPFSKQFSTSGEQWIAIPFAADIQHMAYNRAAVSVTPRTWDDLARQKSPILLPLGSDDAFLLQYLSFGTSLSAFDSFAATQVFAFIKRGHEAGYVFESSPTANNASDAWKAFAAGQVAMAQVSASRYLAGRGQLSPQLNVSFAGVPTRDGKNSSLASASAFVIVTKDPARKTAAAKWIQWLMHAERLPTFLRAAHRLPPYRGMLTATVESKEYAAFLRDLMERAMPMPSIAQYAKKANAWRAGIAGVWRGQMTPEEAAKNIAAVK